MHHVHEMSELCSRYDMEEGRYKTAKSVEAAQQACRAMKEIQASVESAVSACLVVLSSVDLDFVARATAILAYYNTWALRKLLR